MYQTVLGVSTERLGTAVTSMTSSSTGNAPTDDTMLLRPAMRS